MNINDEIIADVISRDRTMKEWHARAVDTSPASDAYRIWTMPGGVLFLRLEDQNYRPIEDFDNNRIRGNGRVYVQFCQSVTYIRKKRRPIQLECKENAVQFDLDSNSIDIPIYKGNNTSQSKFDRSPSYKPFSVRVDNNKQVTRIDSVRKHDLDGKPLYAQIDRRAATATTQRATTNEREIEQLVDDMVKQFTQTKDLIICLRTKLGLNSNLIFGNVNVREAAFDTVRYCESNGLLEILENGIREKKPRTCPWI